MPGARRAAEADVPLERGLEAVVEDHPERDVEAADQRHGRRERGVEDLLRLAASRASRSRSCATAAASSQRRSATLAIARPGGHISAFCEPETTTSIPQASVSSGTAPSDETASTTRIASPTAALIACTSATTPVEVSDCVQKTIAAPLSAHRRADLGRVGHLAPLVVDALHVEPVLLADLRPSARRTPRRRRPRPGRPARVRFATADSIAPVPEALKSSTWPSVRNTCWSRSSVRS